LGSASVSLAVSRILRDTSSERFTAKAEEELFVIGDEMKKRLPHPLSNISDLKLPLLTAWSVPRLHVGARRWCGWRWWHPCGLRR
jgi:hypothetical protein